MGLEEFMTEVCEFFSDGGKRLSETEIGIIECKYAEGYTPEQTADFLKYDGLDDYIEQIRIDDYFEQMLTESCRYE